VACWAPMDVVATTHILHEFHSSLIRNCFSCKGWVEQLLIMSDFSLKRDFHLSDVLSATTGRLVSTRHMDGIYDIMGFVTGDPGISTIGLAMEFERVKGEILNQHPQLRDAAATFPNLDSISDRKKREQAIAGWLDQQVKKFGETLEIKPAQVAIALDLDEQTDFVRSINPKINITPIVIDEDAPPPAQRSKPRGPKREP